MAIYHCQITPLSRSGGRSAPAAAAYRAGAMIHDERANRAWDYRKRDDVAHAEIILPPGVTGTLNREKLWNMAEAAEKRIDARTAW